MNCKKCQELYLLSLDGQLSENKKRRLQQHIERCPACQQEIQQMQTISSQLEKEQKLSPSEHILQQIREKALQDLAGLERKPFFVIPKIPITLPRLAYSLAMIAGVILLVSHLLPRKGPSPILVVDTAPPLTLVEKITTQDTRDIEKYFNDRYVAEVRQDVANLFSVVEETRDDLEILSKSYVFAFPIKTESLDEALRDLERRVEKESKQKKYIIKSADVSL
ncbi:MAG: zf-HC2 domain-containing protein [Deltaproteobacteria bacterium]|nr:zf-HC2 domain-containing protein [Deltaproteobacteria bacterium]